MTDQLSHLTQRLPDALDFLEQMVMMESPSVDKPLVDRFVRFVGSKFEAIGGQVDYIQNNRSGDHLRARFEEDSPGRVLLLGHTDTVWPAGETESRPFKIVGEKAFGPGVLDMKAGILLMWMALGELKKIYGSFGKSITVLLTSDEEIGSESSRRLIESEARQCKAVFVLEPSLPGGALKTARKGVGTFTVKAIGRAAHAGIDPLKGVNAVEEISRQILKLQTMGDRQRGTTVTVGVVQGGTRSNVVPAEATAEVDVRIAALEEGIVVTNAIKRLTPELQGARLEISGSISRPPMERTRDTARLFELAQKVAARIGTNLLEGSTGGASDGNFTSALGIPTLDGLGAIGDGAHSTNEWVDIPTLPNRAALIAGLMKQV